MGHTWNPRARLTDSDPVEQFYSVFRGLHADAPATRRGSNLEVEVLIVGAGAARFLGELSAATGVAATTAPEPTGAGVAVLTIPFGLWGGVPVRARVVCLGANPLARTLSAHSFASGLARGCPIVIASGGETDACTALTADLAIARARGRVYVLGGLDVKADRLQRVGVKVDVTLRAIDVLETIMRAVPLPHGHEPSLRESLRG